MIYGLSVLLAALASLLVAHATRAHSELAPAAARKIRGAALVGALAGAYLFELPADLLGLAPPASDLHQRLGGRTLLGALLGGWLAVELAKKLVGTRSPTGDGFALPLAVALTIGRLGCVFTGCCPGRRVSEHSLLALPSLALHAEARFPAALLEAYFHGAVALVLVLSSRRPRTGRRLAAYLAGYAAVRFLLETQRDVPRPFAGLSYYQLLSIALFLLSAATWLARTPRSAENARPA